MKLKDRVVIISEMNMDNINALYGKCTLDELERIVNNMVDNAIVEINEDEYRLHPDKEIGCSRCGFMREYGYGRKIYYCDHGNRIDDMGKIGVGGLPGTVPEWCPLKFEM